LKSISKQFDGLLLKDGLVAITAANCFGASYLPNKLLLEYAMRDHRISNCGSSSESHGVLVYCSTVAMEEDSAGFCGA
jgi:hypothetical protein